MVSHALVFTAAFAIAPHGKLNEVYTPIDLAIFEVEPEADAAAPPSQTPPDRPEPIDSSPPETEPTLPPTRETPASASQIENEEPIAQQEPIAAPVRAPAQDHAPEDGPPVDPRWKIRDPSEGFVPADDFENARRLLQGFHCARLTQADDPECDTFAKDQLPDELQLVQPGFEPQQPLGENPFASTLDKFAQRQYEDKTTTYSRYAPRTNDHQHANPFSGSQSSAERDLTGSLNSSPDPVFGD